MEKKTGYDWLQELKNQVTLYDLAGFRQDGISLHFSFGQEQITKEEFNKRLTNCNIKWNTEKL